MHDMHTPISHPSIQQQQPSIDRTPRAAHYKPPSRVCSPHRATYSTPKSWYVMFLRMFLLLHPSPPPSPILRIRKGPQLVFCLFICKGGPRLAHVYWWTCHVGVRTFCCFGGETCYAQIGMTHVLAGAYWGLGGKEMVILDKHLHDEHSINLSDLISWW